MPVVDPQNSTNVRTDSYLSHRGTSVPPADGSRPERRRPRRRSTPLAVRAARAGFRVIAPYAPALASTAAERLFLTARRHSRPAWETHALAGAERFTIPHDGQALPAWRWGTGTNVVLLVHGWEGRGSQLASFAEPLVRQGFSVVTFDVPGHGDAPSGISSIVEHARAVASAGAYLGRLHAIIGHSVGGAAALFATRLGLKVDRLALVAPPVSPQRFAAGFGKLLGLDNGVQRGLVRRLERRYGLRMEELDVRADAAEFDGPLLVVHDRGDRVVPIDDGEVIAGAAIGGRLFETHGLGHQRVLRAPEVLAAVMPFVAAGQRAPELGSLIDSELFFRDLRR
jgi:pimeloyl-ACP methyl ester carboxylesterase